MGIEIRTKQEVEEMRPAGRFVAEALQTAFEYAKPGVNLLEIDELIKRMIFKKGAKSCYVDYSPSFGEGAFGFYICTSVNDAVLHGKPYDYALEEGDLLCLDLAVSINGWVADSAVTKYISSTPNGIEDYPELVHLMDTTRQALDLGINAAIAPKRIGDISAAIGNFCFEQGYSVNTEFGGHGVGRVMHGDPHIPNDGKAGRGFKLKPGLVIAIEPWLLETTDEIYIDESDGWTIRSEDGSFGAHFEHTIAVTDSKPIILTAWE